MRNTIIFILAITSLSWFTNEPPTHKDVVAQAISKPAMEQKKAEQSHTQQEAKKAPVEPQKAPEKPKTVISHVTPGSHQDWMTQAGIAPKDWVYVDYIVSHESGWCHLKWNGQVGYCPTSHGPNKYGDGGYGLCQSTPAAKMATAGADWQTNPVTQLKWCSGYAQSRYGGWAGSYLHWLTYHVW